MRLTIRDLSKFQYDVTTQIIEVCQKQLRKILTGSEDGKVSMEPSEESVKSTTLAACALCPACLDAAVFCLRASNHLTDEQMWAIREELYAAMTRAVAKYGFSYIEVVASSEHRVP